MGFINDAQRPGLGDVAIFRDRSARTTNDKQRDDQYIFFSQHRRKSNVVCSAVFIKMYNKRRIVGAID